MPELKIGLSKTKNNRIKTQQKGCRWASKNFHQIMQKCSVPWPIKNYRRYQYQKCSWHQKFRYDGKNNA